MRRKFMALALFLVVVAALLPRLARAQDGCGALGWLIGCDINLREDKQQTQFDLAKIEAQNRLAIEQEAIRVQYEKALLQAKTDEQRTAADMQRDIQLTELEKKRIEVDESITELELQTRERMNAINANTMLNTAALQADMVRDVASSNVIVAQENGKTLIFALFLAVLVCMLLVLAALHYRMGREAASSYLKVLSPRDREMARMLTCNGVPWDINQQGELLAFRDGEVVNVTRSIRRIQ